MLSKEMVEGESYALEIPGSTEFKEIVLRSKTAIRRGRVVVMVRDRSGTERIVEVPSRRIRSSWREHRASALELIDTASFTQVAWLPKGGDIVERSDAPGFWIMRRLDLKAGSALVDGVLVGLRRREVIDVEVIRRPSLPGQPDETTVDQFLKRHGLDLGLGERSRFRALEEWTPSSEQIPEASEIAGHLSFGPTARMQYRWVARRCRAGDEERRMRREVAAQGELRWLDERHRHYLEGEYVRYVVPGRFIVVLNDDPSGVDGLIPVDRIIVLPKRRR